MFRVVGACALVLALGPEVWATTPTDTLRLLVTEANLALTDSRTDDDPMARLGTVRTIVKENIDVQGSAEMAVRRHWQQRTAAERDEFTQLFADLLERSYVAWLASQAKLEGGARVRYLGESVAGGLATVQTAVAKRNGHEMLVDYRMIERGGRWMIRDVVVDWVSITQNYRAQFDRVLQTSSYADLVAQIRARTAGTARLAAAAAQVFVAAAARLKNEKPPVVIPATPPLVAPAAPTVVVVAHTGLPVVAPAAPRAVTPPESPVVPTASDVIRVHQTTRRSYWVQVGTFSDADEVGRLVARLHERNVVLTFGPTRLANGDRADPVLRLRVGPYSDAAEAVSKQLELLARGYDPFLVAERE